MVVDSVAKQSEGIRLKIRYPSNLPDQRVKSRAAAAFAARIVDRLITRPQVDQELDERVLFTALHACAYQAAHARQQAPHSAAAQDDWSHRWSVMRDYLMERNLGLAYTMAKRFRSSGADWDDLRSEAMLALVRAVERFNPWRGFKFSTYACNAIVRALIHLSRRTKKYRVRFPVGHEAWLERASAEDSAKELNAERLLSALHNNLGELTDREALVIGWRFPLHGGFSLSLGQVGEAIGLSKERVRQIQNRALAKLRRVLEADPVMQ